MKKSTLKYLFLILIMGLSVMQANGIIAFAQNETEINLPGKTIKLYPPFEIVSTMMYKDGGTIGIVVEDARGVNVPLCLDGRIKTPQENRNLYIGATHPQGEKAQAVPIGGKEEKKVLKILKSAKIKNPSPYLREDLVETVIDKLKAR